MSFRILLWIISNRVICASVGSHGLLQQGNPEYDAKRQQLYEHYHPLEFSPTIGLEEKTKLMEEWCVSLLMVDV